MSFLWERTSIEVLKFGELEGPVQNPEFIMTNISLRIISESSLSARFFFLIIVPSCLQSFDNE